MWRMMPKHAILTLAATLSLAIPAAPTQASAIQSSFGYSTSGTIAPINGNSIGPVGFTGTSSTLTTPGSINLGQFSIQPLPSTGTLTYTNTPFTIFLDVNNPSTASTPQSFYTIAGTLTGTVTNGKSGMVASITSISGPGLDPSVLPFTVSQLSITPLTLNAPSGATAGSTTFYATVEPLLGIPAAAPEPSSIAAFAAAIAGWGLRRKLRKGRTNA
jgi:hypothetical protein